MATLYVRSTDGLNTDDGSTWDLAKASVFSAATSAAAGDMIAVSQVSVETYSAATTINFANGTYANPVNIASVQDANTPPTTMATTSSISTTGASSLLVRGNANIHGITFNAGNGTNFLSLNINDSNSRMMLYNCKINLLDTHASSNWNAGASSASSYPSTTFVESELSCAVNTQTMVLNGLVRFVKGNVKAGSVIPTAGYFQIGQTGRRASASFEGFDFSAMGAANHLFRPLNGTVVCRNCKLPASWTGKLFNVAPTNADTRAELYNSDVTMVEDMVGTLTRESIQVRTSGSPYTWKVTTTATASEHGPFFTPYGEKQITTVGAPVTLTAEILHDSATALTDAEVWIEGYYLGTNGQAIESFISDRRANILTAAVAQTTSAVPWTTTGMSTPNKQSLAVTFTPQVAGSLMWRVVVGKPSKTLVLDLAVTVA